MSTTLMTNEPTAKLATASAGGDSGCRSRRPQLLRQSGPLISAGSDKDLLSTKEMAAMLVRARGEDHDKAGHNECWVEQLTSKEK